MGFEAGPTRLPLVPAPEEDAKRIIKVVIDGDYEANSKRLSLEFFDLITNITKINRTSQQVKLLGVFLFLRIAK